jgi:hypothetical protein
MQGVGLGEASKIKKVDMATCVAVCTYFHQHYSGFTPVLRETLLPTLAVPPVDDPEKDKEVPINSHIPHHHTSVFTTIHVINIVDRYPGHYTLYQTPATPPNSCVYDAVVRQSRHSA